MPSKKRSILPYYIFIQVIVVGFLALSYLNINKEENPEEKHYEVINLAKEQLGLINSVSDGLLSMLAFDNTNKLSALNQNNVLMNLLDENQEKLKTLIDRSKIEEKDKKEVYKMYETCNTFLNNFKTSQTYVVQKANVSSLASSFNSLVKRNEEGYIKKTNELIAVYEKAENDKQSSQKRQNYFVFGIGLVFLLFNVILLVTPAKKIIFGDMAGNNQ
jgi:two-component system, NarL family, sensor histidine kinase DegS